MQADVAGMALEIKPSAEFKRLRTGRQTDTLWRVMLTQRELWVSTVL
jgi:hypothetical protein